MDIRDRASQSRLSPAQALQRLQEGNARFTSNRPTTHSLLDQVRQTAEDQQPFAVVLGCIDSRVVPELIFDQGIGDLFSVRIAGNVVNDDVLGSLEFACGVIGARLIVVLGHSNCGAVRAACAHVQLGHLSGIVDRILPAVAAQPDPPGGRTTQNAAFVQQVAEKHVELTVAAIPRESPLLGHMLAEGAVAIVGAMYDVATGTVTFADREQG